MGRLNRKHLQVLEKCCMVMETKRVMVGSHSEDMLDLRGHLLLLSLIHI